MRKGRSEWWRRTALALLILVGLAAVATVCAQDAPEAPAEPPQTVEQGPLPPGGATETAPTRPGTFYASPLWLLWAAAVAAFWLYLTSWVSEDAKGVGLSFPLYTAVMFVAGALGVLLTLLVHAAASLLMLAIVVATYAVYVAIRNRAVPERFRLWGGHHLNRIFSQIPLLDQLVKAPAPRQKGERSCLLTSRAGTSLDDIVMEQPALEQAADVITDLVVRAGATRASKIRLQPEGKRYAAQFLLDGVLYKLREVEAQLANQVLACAAHLVGLTKGGKLRQGTGQIHADLQGAGAVAIETRLSSSDGQPTLELQMPDWYGDLLLSGPEALGMHDAIARRIQSAVDQKSGTLLLCSPARNGKTTTMYVVAGMLDVFTTEIALVECEPEHELGHVKRWRLNAGKSFAEIHAELMREGADVLMLGELTEPEQTVPLLEFAAGEGMALTTLKAPDAPQGVLKLLRLAGRDADLVSRSVTCVITQRLVRKLCTNCREPAEPKPEVLQRLGLNPASAGTWYQPIGCEACLHSGYHGRTGVFGMLILTDPVQEALARPDLTPEAIAQAAGKSALRTMYQDGISKVTAGITTLEELRRVLHGAPTAKEGKQ